MNPLRRNLKVKNKPHLRDMHDQGFSLVELMVALTLSTFLLGALIVTYVSGRAASADAENLSRVQENMRFVSDHLLRDIRNAGFRDQLTLTFAQYENIGQQYARIDDQGALIIRYAGRSHCAQSRPRQEDIDLNTELTVVENRYFVDEGRLKCEGRTGGDPRVTDTDLVDGVSRVSFEFLRAAEPNPDDADVCNFDTSADLESACTGVAITLRFAGSAGLGDEREAVLSAAFRNVLVDRIYGRVPEESSEEQGT